MNQKSSLRKILQFVSQALTANTRPIRVRVEFSVVGRGQFGMFEDGRRIGVSECLAYREIISLNFRFQPSS
jgi:hypothetical protein